MPSKSPADLPDHGMPLPGGLDHHRPAVHRAVRAAGDLHHQLESPFGGPEIGVVQQIVGIEDADERHPPEIETLGDHLRADQEYRSGGPRNRR